MFAYSFVAWTRGLLLGLFLVAFAQTEAAKGFAQQDERATQRNSISFELMESFQRGVNLGNFLEVPPEQDWGDNSTTENDFRNIAAEGFDHVRIPIGWHHYSEQGPEFKIKESFFERVEQQLDWAEKHQLAVVINVHHFHEFVRAPAEHRAKLICIWEQIAERFKTRPTTLAFELLNEPNGKASSEVMNSMYADLLTSIRKIDQRHLVIIGPGEWNGVRALDELQVPDDPRLAVTVHTYDPFLFTHQGATWTEGFSEIQGVAFPGPGKKKLDTPSGLPAWVIRQIESYNQAVENQVAETPAFIEPLELAARWGKANHRPIYVGEFGAIATAAPDSRAAFYREFRTTAERLDLGWCIWDWKASFRYWNPETSTSEPGMKAALFDGED